MSSTTALCPRCHAEVLPSMARCRSCAQVLARPAAAASVSGVREPVTAPARASHVSGTGAAPSAARDEIQSPKLESDTNTVALDRGTPSPAHSDKIRIECPCGSTIRASAGLRGKRVKCPKCSAPLKVPELDDESRASAVTQKREPPIERPSAVRPAVPRQSPEPAIAAAESPTDDRDLAYEIELAATRPIPQDSANPANGRIAPRKLKALRKQLETANVLSDSENIARRKSLLELGQSQDPGVMEILVEHAQDNVSVIRDGAITALGDLGDPGGLPTVLRALLDRNADVVRAAFSSLKKIGDMRVARPLLCFGLEQPQWKPLATDTLVRLGSRVVSELLLILQGNDPGLKLDAVVVLGRIRDPQSVPLLVACMDHFSNLLKAHLIEALALIGDPRAVPQLVRALEDSHVAIRANAAAGLARLADPRTLSPLIKALQDEDADVRRYAATALGELRSPKAVPELTKLLVVWESLVSLDPPFLEAIVEALGKLEDVSAVPSLIPLLQSKHDEVLLKTVLALKKLRAPSAVSAMTALLHVPKPTVRRRVVETLGQSGESSLVPLIGGVLRDDPAPEVRAAAARSLGELKSKEAAPFLEDALNQEFKIRCQAVIALGAIRERSTLPALMAMLKDNAPEVRYHAINAISKFKDPKTLKALAVLLEDLDPMVRNGATKAVEEFGQAIEDKAVKEIVRRVKSRDLLAKLIPNWVLLFVPRTREVRRTLAAVLAACVLLGFIIKTTVGGPNKRLVRGNVQALAMSADGETVVAERTLGMLEVWDVNGKKVKQQIGIEEGLRTPLFRPKDGIVLLSGQTVVPWGLSGTPNVSAGWNEHKFPILKSTVSSDGRFAATLCKDMSAVVWDLEAGRKRNKFDLDGRYSTALSISSDGKFLAGGGRVGEAGVWDIESEKRIKELPGVPSSKGIVALAFSPDGSWLVGADESGKLRVWDLNGDATAPKTLELPTSMKVIAVRFLRDSNRIVTASAGGEVRVWPLDGESRVVFSVDFDQLDGFAMNLDETRVAVGGALNSPVMVYDFESGELLKKLDIAR